MMSIVTVFSIKFASIPVKLILLLSFWYIFLISYLEIYGYYCFLAQKKKERKKKLRLIYKSEFHYLVV